MSAAENILSDIDATLDQLIHNANAVNRIMDKPLFTNEIQAMHKTQEGLMVHLIYMHELYESEMNVMLPPAQKMRMKTIEHKLTEFGRLNARLIQQLEKGMRTKRVTARRRKRAAG